MTCSDPPIPSPAMTTRAILIELILINTNTSISRSLSEYIVDDGNHNRKKRKLGEVIEVIISAETNSNSNKQLTSNTVSPNASKVPSVDILHMANPVSPAIIISADDIDAQWTETVDIALIECHTLEMQQLIELLALPNAFILVYLHY